MKTMDNRSDLNSGLYPKIGVDFDFYYKDLGVSLSYLL